MHLTRESEYALRGLVVLAGCPADTTVTLAEIARSRSLPTTFLAKIFQKLARHGLVLSARGPGHGYALARPASTITIHEILESVEGPRLNQRCLLWNRRCADVQPCPLHHHVRVLLPKLDWILQHITLAEYAEELASAQGPQGYLPDGLDSPCLIGHSATSSPIPYHSTFPISEHGAKR